LRLFVIIVLAGIVTGLYVNSLGNDFVQWDDPNLILKNKQIRSLGWSNVKTIFSLRRASTYQPIRVLSYAIDYRLWNLNPLGYHITNITFYLLTCIMIFFATGELLRFLRPTKPPGSNTRIALFTALLYAVHPVHVEAVTWLSARKEVLLGFFLFSSLYFYFRATGSSEKGIKAGLYGMAFLCFVLAALSKPVAVVLPGVILLFEFSRGTWEKGWFIRRALWLAPAILFSFVVILILMRVMVEAGGIYPYRGGGFLPNLVVAFYLFILDIMLMAWTINFSPVYMVDIPFPVLGLPMLVFFLLNVGLISVAIFLFKRSKVVFFAIVWFYITILPFLNIIPISTLVADRYVFIPSFAYSLVLALGFERLWSGVRKGFSRDFFPSLAVAILVALLAGYGYMTIRQNRIWKDSYTLWSEALARDSKNTVAMNGLGLIYLSNGMDEKAFEILKKAVEINPSDPLVQNNLGIAYERMGQYEKSQHHYLMALSLRPGHFEARVNLSNVLAKRGDFEPAIRIMTALLAERPNNSNLHYRLGYLYENAGKLKEAIEFYEASIKLTPHIINPYEGLGHLYMEKQKDREKALYYFKKGIEMAPNSKRVKEIKVIINRLSSN
jgi:Flp pilus assembly protein TadD